MKLEQELLLPLIQNEQPEEEFENENETETGFCFCFRDPDYDFDSCENGTLIETLSENGILSDRV